MIVSLSALLTISKTRLHAVLKMGRSIAQLLVLQITHEAALQELLHLHDGRFRRLWRGGPVAGQQLSIEKLLDRQVGGRYVQFDGVPVVLIALSSLLGGTRQKA